MFSLNFHLLHAYVVYHSPPTLSHLHPSNIPFTSLDTCGCAGNKFPEIDEDARGRRRGKEEGTDDSSSLHPSQNDQNPFKVLLEYTKVQEGKILDVAVIKEPMQDRFVIFGILVFLHCSLVLVAFFASV